MFLSDQAYEPSNSSDRELTGLVLLTTGLRLFHLTSTLPSCSSSFVRELNTPPATTRSQYSPSVTGTTSCTALFSMCRR
ncbi:hypothetical protein POSPLADRAFT_1050696 [Postia placenta MAD-698-R-SB12]|uniref:Uncharacterized protein n=1 Tax=Postia placenta MAD-698-R-SB12 TaxID=670580 RepID=A0A1X6MJT3_9APHY|nr:hypothetical protein POSPLADRAFT_1050696 [Postia placenta MAD-698-R-SB12]OSX56496.1 hypothetical protein POSPLADRAFT_1050696 [Postia placenta MAD-698-R-SB12]